MGKYCAVILALILLSGCRNEYYVEAYKTTAEIESNDKEVLRSRFSSVEFRDFDVLLEWYTYDNDVINRPPYKLHIAIKPKSENLESIEIVKVKLDSSIGANYEVQTQDWPVVMQQSDEKTKHLIFDPAFDFDFKSGEEVESTILLKVKSVDGIQEEELRLLWKPIRIRHHAPVV